jgi:two-component system, OmpR family, response regulator ResD
MAAQRVLVVEDEPMVAEVVERYLRRDGFEVSVASDGIAGFAAFEQWQPDLVVLDIMLPGADGLEVCRRIREQGLTPVILLTARGREADKINGLALGADDYVTKPFSPRELTARVQAVLRRTSASSVTQATATFRIGGLTIDPVGRTLEVNGTPAALTAREFDLLLHLARHAGQAFTRDQLVDAIWTHDFDGDAGTVTVHVRRLRTKIEDDPARPVYLKTVWGVGYRFDG